MAGKETKMTIWALDPEINIDELPDLLQLDYSKNIDYLEEREDLSSFNKKLMHRWREYEDDRGFGVQNLQVMGQEVKCISVYAYFESAAPVDEAVFGNFVVPRERRVARNELPVFFFEQAGRVYAIIIGSEYKTRYVRTLLMGAGRNSNEEQKKWKKVQFKDIAQFSFSSDLFYWLISKQNTKISTAITELMVSDIRYLSQSPDRKDVRHESEGDRLLDEAMPKTGLGVNSRVGQVGTTIVISEGNIRLILFGNGDCYVDNYLSAINAPNGELEPFEDHLETGALMLYTVLFPALRTAYNRDKNNGSWTTEHQAEARKLWALGAINELCSENNITLNEIKQLEWFI